MGGDPDGLTLTMTRELPAVRAVVFRAFVDPDELARWFGPTGFTIPRLEFGARAGERYRIEMQPPDGAPFALIGEIREVAAPRRLAFTFVWEPPSPDDVETHVGLSFRDRGETTAVELTHGVFTTEERRALHHDGWSDSFDKLEQRISTHS